MGTRRRLLPGHMHESDPSRKHESQTIPADDRVYLANSALQLGAHSALQLGAHPREPGLRA